MNAEAAKGTSPPSSASKPKEKKAPPFQMVPLKNIVVPDKWNRQKPGDLRGLISSIKTEGQIIPLLVRDSGKAGKVELVDGRRRLMAMKELKIAEAKVTYVDGDLKRDYVKSLVVNMQRLEHNLVEKAEAFRTMNEMGLRNKDIAQACGITEGSVSQHIGIFELPSKMQRATRDGKLSLGQIRQLLRVNDEEHMNFQEKLFDKMLESNAPTSVAEELTATYLEKYNIRQKEKAAREADKAKGKDKDKSKDKDKDKKGGAADKAATDSAKSKGGRTPLMTDYNDPEIQKDMKTISKKDATEWLVSFEERRIRTKSPKKRERLMGRIEGIEIMLSLRGE